MKRQLGELQRTILLLCSLCVEVPIIALKKNDSAAFKV